MFTHYYSRCLVCTFRHTIQSLHLCALYRRRRRLNGGCILPAATTCEQICGATGFILKNQNSLSRRALLNFHYDQKERLHAYTIFPPSHHVSSSFLVLNTRPCACLSFILHFTGYPSTFNFSVDSLRLQSGFSLSRFSTSLEIFKKLSQEK